MNFYSDGLEEAKNKFKKIYKTLGKAKQITSEINIPTEFEKAVVLRNTEIEISDIEDRINRLNQDIDFIIDSFELAEAKNAAILDGLIAGVLNMDEGTMGLGSYLNGIDRRDLINAILIACEDVTAHKMGVHYSLEEGLGPDSDIEECYNNNAYAICCATYVAMVLYKSGVIAPDNINPYYFHSINGIRSMVSDSGWKQVSVDWDEVTLDKLEPGDIVMNTTHSGEEHVLIYIGNGLFWDNTGCAINNGQQPSGNPRSYYDRIDEVWRLPEESEDNEK